MTDTTTRNRGSSIADSPKTNENVFLFVPNIIGYVRIITAAISLVYMPSHPKFCTLLYGLSSILDAVDGQAARALGQASRTGAILDMLTDRCATTCLLCFLGTTYPSWQLLFQFMISLDFASHYIHMYSTLVTGARSHKTVTKSQSRILHSYYNNNLTLFSFCAGNELFWVSLYLIHWYPEPVGLHTKYLVSFLPAEFVRQVPVDILRFFEKLSWPYVLAVLTFPVMLGKSIISMVQFTKAAKAISDLDREERYRAKVGKSR